MKKKIFKGTKSILSFILAAAMVMGLSGMTTLAADTTTSGLEEAVETQTILVKEQVDGYADTDFSFFICQVTESNYPIETIGGDDSDIHSAEAGADLSYTIYDSLTNEALGIGTTDGDGGFSLEDGEYAEFIVPAGTDWYVRQNTPEEYPLAEEDGVTAEGTYASVVTSEEDIPYGIVQYEPEEEPAPTAEPDKTALQEAYDDGLTLDESEYTAESWEPFAAAMEKAKEVLDDEDATQEAIDEALAGLEEARDGLKKAETEPTPTQTVDKTALQTEYDADVLLKDKESDYTPESWEPFEKALDKALEVINDADATQEEVDEALADLQDAKKDLKEAEQADKTALQEEYDADSTFEENDYTPESWEPFADAMKQAKDVLDNADATQEEVDEALAELVEAKDGLKKAETEPTPEAPTVTISTGLTGNEKTYDGEGITLTAEAEGSEGTTLTYQWYLYDGETGAFVPIEDAAESTYTLAGDVSDSGLYMCTVTATDADGNETSGSAAVTITIEKADQEISYEETLLYKTTDDGPFTNELAVGDISPEDGAGIRYTSSDDGIASVDPDTGEVTIHAAGTVVITATAEGTANYAERSASYVIEITEAASAPTVTDVSVKAEGLSDDNTKRYNGEEVTLSVTAEAGPEGAEVSYQWYKKNADGEYEEIEDAAGAELTLAGDVSDSGEYKCVVTAVNDGLTASGESTITITIEKAAQDISYEQTTVEKYDYDEPFINGLTKGEAVYGEITYKITEDAALGGDLAVEIDEETGEVTIHGGSGVVYITATAAETDNYAEATASYMLTVNEDKIDWAIGSDHGQVDWDEDKGEYEDGLTYSGEPIVLTLSLTLTAEEEEELAGITYQWYRYTDTGLEEIEGAVEDTLTLEDADVNAGDYTYVCVAAVTYKNGYTHEVYCPIEVVIEKADQEIYYEAAEIEKTVGDADFTNTLTVVTAYPEDGSGIGYSVSGDEGVAGIDPETGEVTITGAGTVTITATAAESDNYNEATASYTLRVMDAAKEAFAVFSEDDSSLSFYYDIVPDEGDTYDGKVVTDVYTGLESTPENTDPEWSSIGSSVTSVAIDDTFEVVQPTSLYGWFHGFSNLTEINGLEYLDTSNVTNMSCTFQNCTSMQSLDISGWNTSNVTSCASFATGLGDDFDWIKIGDNFDLFTKSTAGLVSQKNWYDSDLNGNQVSDNYMIGVSGAGQYWTHTEVYEVNATIILTLTDDYDNAEGEEKGIEKNPLGSGMFTLYRIVADGEDEALGTYRTGEDGRITVEGLGEGEYYFVETHAPDGYLLPDDPKTESVVISAAAVRDNDGMFYVNMENERTGTVRYAVKVWGINQDTYSDNGGETLKYAGLTFGPATGGNRVESYVSRETVIADGGSHDSTYCIHDMYWDEIIEQSKTDPTVFADCKKNGCTKAVELTPNETLFRPDTVNSYIDWNYSGDGVTTLFYLLAHGTTGYGVEWNYTWNTGTSTGSQDAANIYSRSRIRTTLTGDRENIDAWLGEGGHNNYYYGDDMPLCDASNCLLSCFPSNLQDAVVARTTVNIGNATSGTYKNWDNNTTYDKLFLFSLKEAGLTVNTDDGGGLDYGVNSSDSDRVAYEFGGPAATNSDWVKTWWTRSRVSSNLISAYCITGGGVSSTSSVDSHSSGGLAPGFSLPGPDATEIEQTAFAIYSEDDNSLTFYKGFAPTAGERYKGKVATYVYTDLESLEATSDSDIPWNGVAADVKTVLIDASFKAARPVSLAYWFYGFTNASFTDGLVNTSYYSFANIDTSEVTSLDHTFYDCTDCVNLDVSDWDTENVTNLNSTFCHCAALATLDVSDWDTENVINMSSAFQDCASLASLDLSGWDTANVTLYGDFATGLSDDGLDWIRIGDDFDLFEKSGSALVSQQYWYDNDIDGEVMSDNYMIGVTNATSGNTSGQYWTHTIPSEKIAFAVYSADDTSFTFYVDYTPLPEEGNIYKGKTVTYLYTDVDSVNATSTSNIPWNRSAVINYATSVVFDESFQDAQPVSLAYWFYGFKYVTSFSGFEYLDTSKVTSMYDMFWTCSSLTSLDLSALDVSSVKNMGYMFYNCTALTSLNASNWNVSRVTDMKYMFNGCSALTSVNASNWVASRVTSMQRMFYNCSALSSLDTSTWDLSSVTNMTYMFYNCSALTTLDVSKWDTGSVEDMSYLFYGCSSLLSLDASNWDTSNVTTMSNLFYNCAALTSVGSIGNWDTSSLTNLGNTFEYCASLENLDLSGWDTSNVTYMSYMFRHCTSMKTLDLSGWNTSKVTAYTYFARDCGYENKSNVLEWIKIGDKFNLFTKSSSKLVDQQYWYDSDKNGNTVSSNYMIGVSGAGQYWTHTEEVEPEAFAVYSEDDSSLSFYYDGVPDVGDTYDDKVVTAVYTGLESLAAESSSDIPWNGLAGSVTSVVIDESFKTAQPISFAYWFFEFSSLESVAGMSNWDTSKVTTTYGMFYGCGSLESLDLSGWDTTALTNAGCMFNNCYSMESLDISGWDTSNVTSYSAFADGMGYKDADSQVLAWIKIGDDFDLFTKSSNSLVSQQYWYDRDANGNLVSDNYMIGVTNASSGNTSGQYWTYTEEVEPGDSIDFVIRGEDVEVSSATIDAAIADAPEQTLSYTAADGSTVDVNAQFILLSALIDADDFYGYTVTTLYRTVVKALPTETYLYMDEDTGEYRIAVNGGTEEQWAYSPVTIDVLTEAFAVYSSDDNSLAFYADSFVPEAGDTYNYKSVTNVYEGVERTGSGNPPWYADRTLPTRVAVDESFKVVQPTSLRSWFYGFTNLTTFDGGENLDTSQATTMYYMFYKCSALTGVDASGWDTSNVTTMYETFANCSALTSLDLSGWDTSNVTTMRFLFDSCSALTSVGDLSEWDTSKVTVMYRTFGNCRALTSLDLSGWDTAAAADMQQVFYNCSSLESLDVSGWDVSGVTTMYLMFDGCAALTSLDLSAWKPAKVQSMEGMFEDCGSLTGLGDVSKWDTSSVTTMVRMFQNCSSLTSVESFAGWNTGNVTTMQYMFDACSALTTAALTAWDTAKVTTMAWMFRNCTGLTYADVSGLDLSSCTNIAYLFQGCSSLTGVNVSGLDTSGVTNMSYMFQNCSSLETLDVSDWDTSKVTTRTNFATGCSSLDWIKIGANFDMFSESTSKIVDHQYWYDSDSDGSVISNNYMIGVSGAGQYWTYTKRSIAVIASGGEQETLACAAIDAAIEAAPFTTLSYTAADGSTVEVNAQFVLLSDLTGREDFDRYTVTAYDGTEVTDLPTDTCLYQVEHGGYRVAVPDGTEDQWVLAPVTLELIVDV